MKLDVRTKVLDYEGNELPDGSLPDMRSVITYALDNGSPGENLSEQDKLKIFRLRMTIARQNNPKVDSGDRDFIKTRGGLTLPPLYYGRLCEFLEGEKPAIPSTNEDEPLA